MAFEDRGVTIPAGIRAAVEQRDNGHCVVCGNVGVDLHHLRKRSQGGQHTVTNLATVCRRCHGLLEANRISLELHDTTFYVRGSRRALFS
jgi:hypothetical protein